MPVYCIYTLLDCNTIAITPSEIECASDKEAIEEANTLLCRHDIEVWQSADCRWRGSFFSGLLATGPAYALVFGQSHSSLGGHSAAQCGMDMMLPTLAPAPDPEPAVTLVDPLPDPYPPPFGLVGTLQNVAVISSSQITPVLVSGDVTVRPPTPSGCCGFDPAPCAAAGDAAKSSTEINASFLISAARFRLHNEIRGRWQKVPPRAGRQATANQLIRHEARRIGRNKPSFGALSC